MTVWVRGLVDRDALLAWALRPSPVDARQLSAVDTRLATRAAFAAIERLSPNDPARLDLRDYLVRLHLPLVEHLARRFVNRGEPLDDLTQVGTIGLLKAIDRFVYERGVEFSTYATPTILGEIKRHFRDRGWSIRVPRRLQEMRLALAATTAELTQELGRSPTMIEIAERLDIDEDSVVEGLASANAYSTVSLDATDSREDAGASMLDALGEDDAELGNVEYRASLRPLLAALDPRDQRILVLRFFYGMTQSQIADEIGMSQMHVSRLLSRTLARLRQALLPD
ncbi:MAG TPA: RNA polymerase sigma factor SigF [Nocardioidaceae bacterium]|nr:RNA polymerase sigma factor SigF [Nocardioidaceae bacterium]